MTITASDVTPAADNLNDYRVAARNSGGNPIGGGQVTVPAGESIDMGGFFSDLSHNDAQSVLGKNEVDANGNAVTPAVVPDLLVHYEDVQDANYNSWAKVENYDQYDDSGSPQLVGVDSLGPKLQQSTQSMSPTNTFLYDVTTASGITLVAAHANGDVTDADSIYTYDSTAGAAPGANSEDDYPLFHLWGYNSTTSASHVAASRAVLKLNGVTDIDASVAQAYIYSPANTAHDIDETMTEAEVENYITASAIVDDSAGAAQVEQGLVDEEDDATISTSGVTAPALLVGIPAYGAGWNSTTDILVVEDVLMDGVPYTLHLSIPSHSTTELTSDVLETDNLPTMKVYRKVSFNGLTMLADASDDTNVGNLLAGNSVTTTFNPSISFNYREDLASVTSSISYSIGTDADSATDDDRVTFTSTSAAKDATLANQVDLSFDFNTEGSTKYIGHGATFSVTATDYDGEESTFTVTLNLGHGALTLDADAGNTADDNNDGAIDEDGDTIAEVVDPILNIISGSAVE